MPLTPTSQAASSTTNPASSAASAACRPSILSGGICQNADLAPQVTGVAGTIQPSPSSGRAWPCSPGKPFILKEIAFNNGHAYSTIINRDGHGVGHAARTDWHLRDIHCRRGAGACLRARPATPRAPSGVPPGAPAPAGGGHPGTGARCSASCRLGCPGTYQTPINPIQSISSREIGIYSSHCRQIAERRRDTAERCHEDIMPCAFRRWAGLSEGGGMRDTAERCHEEYPIQRMRECET
ncbi:hypothetical protein BMS3Abin12_00944 [bacterium BMS3Abin12]|nr:hypothetical protein BMS3Abin12_00944 [bacterium BMS3Abin12]